MSKLIQGSFTVPTPAVNKFISLPYLPYSFEWVNKTKFGTTTANSVVTRGIAYSDDANANGGYVNISTGSAMNQVILDVNTGIQFISQNSYGFGPTLTISGIVAATGVVTTTTNHGYAIGDTVRLYGTTGMLQVSGNSYDVTAVTANTFTIGTVPTSGFAANATAGFCKKVLFPDLYIPEHCFITNLSYGATTTVTTNIVHNFVVGQEVRFVMPTVSGTVWGPSQLNGVTAFVLTVSATSFTVNINSTGYPTFTWPTSAQAAAGLTYPQVYAVGDQNTGYSLNSSGNVPYLGVTNGIIGIPGAFAANTRQGVIFPAAATFNSGTATNLFAASDVVEWSAVFPDQILNQ